MTPEQVIADALIAVADDGYEGTWHEAAAITAALHAAGLLPGPGDIVVSREALAHYVKHAADPDTFYPPDPQDCQDCAPVTDALSRSHPEETP